MLTLKHCNNYYYCQSALFSNSPWKLQRLREICIETRNVPKNYKRQMTKTIRACSDSANNSGERRSFLTLEEAGLVEMSGLDAHERFLCRLTISSLNLLRVVSEQEGCSIEELNAGKICDWFVKDKLKKEQNIDSAVLQWDDSGLNL